MNVIPAYSIRHVVIVSNPAAIASLQSHSQILSQIRFLYSTVLEIIKTTKVNR